ncbi:MAG: GIY-YIG nuclease family protein [Chthoniobacterales bacterium]
MNTVILSRGDGEGSHNYREGLFVYMMTNASRGVLYTGVTNSLIRRVWEHQNGTAEGFTKRYKLNRLVYFETCERPHDAISREKELKGWTRAKKNTLIHTKNPKWADLSSMLYQPARDSSPSPRLRMTDSAVSASQSPAP